MMIDGEPQPKPEAALQAERVQQRAQAIQRQLSGIGAAIDQIRAEQRNLEIQLAVSVLLIGMVGGLVWAVSKQLRAIEVAK
jgi:hypothetical protein